ncbi:hypothetical protein GH714_025910 [Hevea brasiliensis]|uniref:Uncharacterized protein n=1 Tax=Hevea brasiliensis TaxID=3981 RepID=A0A6A6LSI3_HEVBR|nr:hypothetical protein GH714_025910 [Hevea brasiliensis]
MIHEIERRVWIVNSLRDESWNKPRIHGPGFLGSKRFFELPLAGDYKEGYYIGVEVPEDDPQAEKPFYGPNVWPAADVLSGWRQTMERFHKEALEVARAVARIIALGLDQEADFFDRPEMLGQPIAILRLLRYGGSVYGFQGSFLLHWHLNDSSGANQLVTWFYSLWLMRVRRLSTAKLFPILSTFAWS